ncbi:hypothetical protein NLX83_01810 [Allokutzneria sp. A3M-2-11 16]|uniref:hypothetical protein n=1 Tax=Allokutzneria sp. A3M-2-11 16 TaxID=2962043 RepID=UPI0020B6F849|nr:hypothetical protein [Allokutzneria sp. A3M-2-11 16]MCP3797985.1 hypothetical protein [Allokutzneria sp. A3M-2-11 16]
MSMHHTTRNILGEVEYLRRSCEILLGQLREIGGMATGTEQLTPIQEAAVADAHVAQAERAKEHLELAGQYLQGWQRAINDALVMEPSWQR